MPADGKLTIETAVQLLDEALQQANTAHMAVMHTAQALRRLTEERIPDNVIHARLQDVLDALKKYGGHTYLQVYGDGSMTVNVEAVDGFHTIIAGYTNVKELLAAGPDEWENVKDVNGSWSIHKPTARSGDYRFPETWSFGSTKNTRLYREKEVDMDSYREVFGRGRHDRLEHVAADDNPYPEASPARIWWRLGWLSTDADIQRARKMGLTPAYWDCECDVNYIRPHTEDRCNRCGALQVDQPWARIEEVQIVHGDCVNDYA